MNNKIEELMRRSGTDSSGKWMGIDNAEKFARLVIEECIQDLINHGYTDAAYVLTESQFGVQPNWQKYNFTEFKND